MARKSKKNADAVATPVADAAPTTEVSVDTSKVGSAVTPAETFTLGDDAQAHNPVGVLEDLPTAHVDPAEVFVAFDARTVPAANQHEIDTAMAVDIFIRGQRQPAVAYKDEIDNKLCIITGRTRRRAVLMLREGFTAVDPRTGETVKFHKPDATLWVAIDKPRSKEDAFVLDLTTQIKTNPLTTVQEAYAVKQLVEKFSWSLTDAAKFFGYGNTNRQAKLLRLLAMEQAIIEKVHAGNMSLDAAISLEGLKPETRLALIERATDAEGNVDGGKLKELLRDIYSQSDAAVAADDGTGEEDEGDDEPTAPKGVSLTRNTSKLKAFIDAQVSDEEADLSEPAKELLKAFAKWINGVKFGDTALKNALKVHCKAKLAPKE